MEGLSGCKETKKSIGLIENREEGRRGSGWIEGADPIRLDDDWLCSNQVFICVRGNW